MKAWHVQCQLQCCILWNNQGDDQGLRKLISPIESVLRNLPKAYVKDGAVSIVSHGAPLASTGLVKMKGN